MTPPVRSLDAIEVRLKATTHGEWRAWDKRGKPTVANDSELDKPESEWTGRLPQSCFGVVADGSVLGNFSPWSFEDAEFIAHAKADIAHLLAIARTAEQTRAAFAEAGDDTETWYLNLTDAMVKLAALLTGAPPASPR